MKFRKKPVVIEATQWFKNGDHPADDVGLLDATHGGQSNTIETEGKWCATFAVLTKPMLASVTVKSAARSCTFTAGLTRWKVATLFAPATGLSRA